MRFIHIDVNFDITYEGHQNLSKILSTDILRVSSDYHNICEPHYVNLFIFVNLPNCPGVWFFDIWHLFDNFKSFDILTHYLNHVSLSQAGSQRYMWHVPTPCMLLKMYISRWGTGVMGHMGDEAQEHNSLNTAGIFLKFFTGYRYWCVLLFI